MATVCSSVWDQVYRTLLLLLMVEVITAGETMVRIKLDPESSFPEVADRVNLTVTCSAFERRNEYSYRRYHRQSRTTGTYEIVRMRILKASGDGQPWMSVAEISSDQHEKVYLNPSFTLHTASGVIRTDPTMLNSELQVTWEGQVLDAVESFKCGVVFVERQNQGNAIYKQANSKLDISNANSQTFTSLMKLQRTSLLAEVGAFCSENDAGDLFDGVRSEWGSKKTDLQSRLDALRSRLLQAAAAEDAKLEEVKKSVLTLLSEANEQKTRARKSLQASLDTALASSYLMFWPQGSYALPKPASGCADEEWTESWRRQHTESTDRDDDHVSETTHLAQPVLQRENRQNYVLQRFCVKSNTDPTKNHGHGWPRGSYCTNKVGACPSGFTEGSIMWDGEDTAASSTSAEPPAVLPDGQYDDSQSTVRYCCRNDSNPERPMDLPRFKPFYLYRHGGKCQQVTGMYVSDEFIYFDTENNKNADMVEGLVPDVELNNIRLHLCYYGVEDQRTL